MKLKEQLRKITVLRKTYQWLWSVRFSLATIISPTLNTKMRYKTAFGKNLDLNHPQTLNEKVLWLKLNQYMKDTLIIQCVDKYRVREYIQQHNCEDMLIDLLGAYDRPEEIPWDTLPQQFVLKWNFGAGMNIVCRDKTLLDIQETVRQLKKWRKNKYWLPYSEMQYKYVPKKIVCEKFLTAQNAPPPRESLPDYKVFCFHGEPKCIMVCIDRAAKSKTKYLYYDTQWNLISWEGTDVPEEYSVIKPECLPQLLQNAATLSAKFPFVRVDFYIVNNRIYFGELTFTPTGGLDVDRSIALDLLLGSYLKLPGEDITA